MHFELHIIWTCHGPIEKRPWLTGLLSTVKNCVLMCLRSYSQKRGKQPSTVGNSHCYIEVH